MEQQLLKSSKVIADMVFKSVSSTWPIGKLIPHPLRSQLSCSSATPEEKYLANRYYWIYKREK